MARKPPPAAGPAADGAEIDVAQQADAADLQAGPLERARGRRASPGRRGVGDPALEARPGHAVGVGREAFALGTRAGQRQRGARRQHRSRARCAWRLSSIDTGGASGRCCGRISSYDARAEKSCCADAARPADSAARAAFARRCGRAFATDGMACDRRLIDAAGRPPVARAWPARSRRVSTPRSRPRRACARTAAGLVEAVLERAASRPATRRAAAPATIARSASRPSPPGVSASGGSCRKAARCGSSAAI